MILEPSTSSGELAVGTTAVLAVPGLLTSIVLTPGSAASSVKVYDNASAASGTILWELAGAASGPSIPVTFNSPIFATKGLTVVVAGTAATAQISYIRSF